MKKISLVLFAGMCILLSAQFCNAQLSVFGYNDFDDVVGWKVGANNSGCQRARAAEEDYYRRGGKQIGLQRFSGLQQQCGDNQYGCYALVKGFNTNPSTNVKRAVYSFISGGADTKEEAERRATDSALYNVLGADRGTISVLTSGCIAKPSSPLQPANPSAKWSGWVTGGDCFRKVSYRYMSRELVDLNYQFHYYFEARNDYPETIFFILSLKDASGRERFGTRHTIAPGQTIKFAEKMDKNYIKTFAIEKVRFKSDTGDYAACDDERTSAQNTTPPSKPDPAKDATTAPNNGSSPIDGKWERDDKGLQVDVAIIAEGLSWTIAGSDIPNIFKQLSADTYRLEAGKNFYMIKVVSDKRLSYWENGSLKYFYNRASSSREEKKKGLADENISASIEGDWQGEDWYSHQKLKLEQTSDGLTSAPYIDYPSELGVSTQYKKISKDTYSFTLDEHRFTIKFINSNRFQFITDINNPTPMYYNRISPKTNETKSNYLETDLTKELRGDSSSSIAGTWEGDNGSTAVITGLVDGLNWSLDSKAPVHFNKTAVDSYFYRTPLSNSAIVLKVLGMNRIEAFVNGEHHAYFTRLAADGESKPKAAPDATPSPAGTWDGDNGGMGMIEMTDNGFNWKNQGQGFSSTFKKISSDTYRFDDGPNFCIVKFISDTKLDYACNGSHYAYFTRRK